MPASQPLPGALRTLTQARPGLSRIPRASAGRPALRKTGSRCLSSRTTAPHSSSRTAHRPLPASSPTTTITTARHYHPTTTHTQPPSPFGATETAILTAAYAHVPTQGFTPRSLALGARDAGYPPVSAAAGALSDPAQALVRWHLATRRRLLAERARELFPEDGSGGSSNNHALTQAEVNARAELLAWERLLLNEPVIGRWQEVSSSLVSSSSPGAFLIQLTEIHDAAKQAQAIMAQPTFAPECIAELARLADDVWALAGDAAVDPSWYAKRAALSAVYAAAELYMTTDRSPGFRETREFVRRRFAETAEVGRAVSSVGQWLGFTAVSGLNVLRSKGVNV